MAGGTVTIERMAGKKKPSATKQNRSPASIIYVRVKPKLGDALQKFLDSLEFEPTQTAVVSQAIQEFLERKGFWPPPN